MLCLEMNYFFTECVAIFLNAGITLATALVNAGMTSFEKISNTNARDLEMASLLYLTN